MPKYNLVVSDLDGTLLTSDMTLSKENSEAIEKMTKLGVEFAVSSGRTLYEIPSSVRENGNIRYLAYSNGTAIYDKAIGRDIYSSRISKEDTEIIFKILKDYDVIVAVHAEGNSYFPHKQATSEILDRYQVNEYYKEIFFLTVDCESIEEKAQNPDGLEAIVLFFSSDAELSECRDRLLALGTVTVTSSIEHNLELCSKSAGKGKTLEYLIEHLGLAKETVIAVGDNTNDVSMFSAAGLSLCVEDGREDAKALADEVICSAREHAARYILEHYF